MCFLKLLIAGGVKKQNLPIRKKNKKIERCLRLREDCEVKSLLNFRYETIIYESIQKSKFFVHKKKKKRFFRHCERQRSNPRPRDTVALNVYTADGLLRRRTDSSQ